MPSANFTVQSCTVNDGVAATTAFSPEGDKRLPARTLSPTAALAAVDWLLLVRDGRRVPRF
jgi:hypothetical protein